MWFIAVSQAHLALPVRGVDEDDAVRKMVIRPQDVIQLIINCFTGNLESTSKIFLIKHQMSWNKDQINSMKRQRLLPNIKGMWSNVSNSARIYGMHQCVCVYTCRGQCVCSECSLSRLLALSFGGRLVCRSFSDVLLPLRTCFTSCLRTHRDPAIVPWRAALIIPAFVD